MLFTAVIIVIMLVLVFTPIVLTQIERITSLPFSPEIHALWNDYFLYTSAFILFLMVANLYYILPNIRQRVRSVVPGALLTVLLWIGAAKLFTIYITNVDQVSLIYGSLGGIIATLLFFFIMNIIFIYGAEFNYQLQTALGRRIEEREHSAQS